MSKTKKNNDEQANFKVITSLKGRLHIPDEVRHILPEKDDYDGVDLGKLEVEVIKKSEYILNRALVDYGSLKENPDDSKLEEVTKMIFECLTCLKHLSDSRKSLPLIQIKFKATLHNLINSEHEFKIKNVAALISEKIIQDCCDFDPSDDTNWALLVYIWLLNAVEESDSNGCNPFIKRVAVMGKAVVRHGISLPSVPLLKCVTNERYLKLKEGRQHLASLFSHASLLSSCHARVWEAIPTLKPVDGTYYGEVYSQAWNQAIASVRSEMELLCFQSFIEKFLKLHRPGGTELTTPAKVIFNILHYLHTQRGSVQFSVALTKVYMPLIWRATKSDHPIIRCNAAQLLFDIFPMEKCQSNTVENNLYKEKQFKELTDLLMDECHFCRIVSVRYAARIMSDVVTCLTSEQWNKLVYILADDLANDGPSPLVRREVFLTLANVISSERCAPLMAPIIPHLCDHFHDTNARVRKAFVEILLKVDSSEKLSMTFTDVVPMSHIVARLSIEDALVGKPLVKLLMPKFYFDGCNLKDMIARLQKLICMNQKAAENLFKYSKAALSPQQMQLVIIGILAHLRKVAKAKLGDVEIEGGKQNNTPNGAKSPPFKKKKLSDIQEDANCSNVTQASVESTASSRQDKENQQEAPSHRLIECHTGLLICVQVGWQAFAKEFSEPENEELLNNLYKLTVASVQSFLRFYKGTPAFYATVAFSSLVPVTKLSHETTVTSTCLSELRTSDLSTPRTHLKALIRALCEWNRGHDVIYLALDWIDFAFRHYKLNQSVFHEKKGKRKTRVRFEPTLGKEVLGLKILNILFSDFLNENKILAKQYEAVNDLFGYLEQVKIIIESKFVDRQSVGSICDKFLLDCIELLYKLAFALHKTPFEENKDPALNKTSSDKDEDPVSVSREEIRQEGICFSAPSTFINLIDWAYMIVFPNFPKVPRDFEDVDASDPDVLFPLQLMSGLLKACIVSIQMDLTSEAHLKASTILISKLLASDWKFYFICDGLSFIKAAVDYVSVWMPDDHAGVVSYGVTPIYKFCLLALKDTPPSVMNKFEISIKNLKKDILVLPLLAAKVYGVDSLQFMDPFDQVLSMCCSEIFRDIQNANMVEARPTFSEHPTIVNLLMPGILTNSSLLNATLSSMKRIIEQSEGHGLPVSCVSLLFTIVKWNTKSKLKNEYIKDIIDILQAKLKSLSENTSPEEEEEDSFYKNFDPCVDAGKLLEETATLVERAAPVATPEAIEKGDEE